MGRQVDEPGFDPANDEWGGAGARWDQQSSIESGSGWVSSGTQALRNDKAPAISKDDFRVVFEALDSGGLSMTYERCLARLREAGHEPLHLEHVALVAEMTEIRSSRREWTGVPAPIRKLAESLRAKRARRQRKRR